MNGLGVCDEETVDPSEQFASVKLKLKLMSDFSAENSASGENENPFQFQMPSGNKFGMDGNEGMPQLQMLLSRFASALRTACTIASIPCKIARSFVMFPRTAMFKPTISCCKRFAVWRMLIPSAMYFGTRG